MLCATIHGDRWKLAIAFAIAAIVIFTLTPQAVAQSVAVAEVDGHVQDPSGQAIVGATVKMTELDRNQVRVTTTDSTGRYAMPNLAVGAYRLEVTSAGFKSYI